MSARYIVADVFEGLASLPDDSVDLVLTSPPFLALRSYLPADHPDKGKELGSEATPADFLDTMLDVVEACDRVLAPHGSLVFELGDTYAGSGGGGGDYYEDGLRAGQPGFTGSAKASRDALREANAAHWRQKNANKAGWPLPKSLTGTPTLFAWSLAYGRNLLRPERETEPWRIRNLIAWVRPNPPVGALGDKFRPATSYLTVACKSDKRYFDLDAVREPYLHPNHPQVGSATVGNYKKDGKADQGRVRTEHPAGAPPLDWWKIVPGGYSGAHYAVFPPELCVKPIKAMCPERVCRVCGEPSRRIVGDAEYEPSATFRGGHTNLTESARVAPGVNQFVDGGGKASLVRVAPTLGWTDCNHNDYRLGVVLDPFAGSGTTLMVATGHGRDAIGIDLDSRNADLARERLGMFLTVEEPSLVGA